MVVDTTAAALGLAYGLLMGSYPVPIKSSAVLAASVHPIVFQGWKSFWVCITALLFFALPAVLRGVKLRLSWWAVASAAAWVPGGLCTVAAVPRVGLSLAIVIASATCSILTFLGFWLLFGEQVRQHELAGVKFYAAPIWLAACLLGMVGLVSAGASGSLPAQPSELERLGKFSACAEGVPMVPLRRRRSPPIEEPYAPDPLTMPAIGAPGVNGAATGTPLLGRGESEMPQACGNTLHQLQAA